MVSPVVPVVPVPVSSIVVGVPGVEVVPVVVAEPRLRSRVVLPRSRVWVVPVPRSWVGDMVVPGVPIWPLIVPVWPPMVPVWPPMEPPVVDVCAIAMAGTISAPAAIICLIRMAFSPALLCLLSTKRDRVCSGLYPH